MKNFTELKQDKLKAQLNRYLNNEVEGVKLQDYQLKVLRDYDKFNIQQKLDIQTKLARTSEIVTFFQMVSAPPEQIKEEHINNYLKHIEENGYTEGTINAKRMQLINFFEWFYGKDKADIPLIKNIKIGKVDLKDSDIMAGKVLKPEDIRKMISVCDNIRDKTIVIMLYETAARISEFLALKRSDVELTNEKYAFVTLPKIKTKARRIPLIYSMAYLTQYLNSTEANSNADDPLFMTNNVYNGKRRPLDEHGVRRILGTVSKRAGIKKPFNAHWYRHSRLTELGGLLKESELRLFAGWVAGSPMARVYVHQTIKDVTDKLLAKEGIIDLEQKEIDEKVFKVIVCPRCNKENEPDKKYCICGFCLDLREAQKEIEESKTLRQELDEQKKKMDRFEKAMLILEKIEKNPSLLRMRL